MGDLLMRRREMALKEAGQTWPIFVEVPMTLKTICNGGTITSKNDWRSSGYVEYPAGSTGVYIHNTGSSNISIRGGRPTSNTQTTNIEMINSGSFISIKPGARSGPWLNKTGWIYLSRSGTSETPLTLEFVNA